MALKKVIAKPSLPILWPFKSILGGSFARKIKINQSCWNLNVIIKYLNFIFLKYHWLWQDECTLMWHRTNGKRFKIFWAIWQKDIGFLVIGSKTLFVLNSRNIYETVIVDPLWVQCPLMALMCRINDIVRFRFNEKEWWETHSWSYLFQWETVREDVSGNSASS